MDNREELTASLTTGLAELSAGDAHSAATEAVNSLAELTASLHHQLASLPDDTRRLIHTADSGFASTGKWVDEAIEAQNQKINELARATKLVATWLGPNGDEAERIFVIRGNMRGWAHRWRKEDKGTAQVDSDPGFVAFASDCLTKADIGGDHEAMIANALRSDWRTC